MYLVVKFNTLVLSFAAIKWLASALHVVPSQRLTSDKRGEIVAQIRKMARLNTVQKREVTSDHHYNCMRRWPGSAALQQVVFAVLYFVPQNRTLWATCSDDLCKSDDFDNYLGT